ncbi:MarR family winged helix-turn-helix transcriptional regulator [Lysinibacillus sphaericus]|uniref:MarR family winged helix-turn-helix transcriptional regulator n=1 Tax=Lysinibacillus sphaericus TaxID=1421 RepID=UPI002DB9A096|nr:MarR family winged helix-turn-helix transcriptional regulator [Lysinibacillus sphaericus]MEB7453894.1 MarR family winged helix-turn-helix transcriptional regulator [Lysinibacillus sphaericus]
MKNQQNTIVYTQICVCANLRKKTRVVTQLYDKLLQPTGLKVTQYSMLAHIDLQQAVSISRLGEILLLDQTTVTRNINLLKQYGYVELKRDPQDARTKNIMLTEKGLEKLHEAAPIWQTIQDKIIDDIGVEKYADFFDTLRTMQKIIQSYEEQ